MGLTRTVYYLFGGPCWGWRLSAEPGLLGLYWPAREQPFEECVTLSLETFRALQANGYKRFFHLGYGRRKALEDEFAVSVESVSALLAKGVNRTDLLPREPIPELGWRLGVWSGDADDESYSVAIHCGCYSLRVGNSVLLKLPSKGPHSLAASPDGALSVYQALVDLWHPSKAVLCAGRISWDGGRIVPENPPLALLQLEPGR
jgi:hypothetical protein